MHATIPWRAQLNGCDCGVFAIMFADRLVGRWRTSDRLDGCFSMKTIKPTARAARLERHVPRGARRRAALWMRLD